MNNMMRIIGLSLLFGSYAAPALALQELCEASPENPTVILGMIGAAAAGYPHARRWLKNRLGRGARPDGGPQIEP